MSARFAAVLAFFLAALLARATEGKILTFQNGICAGEVRLEPGFVIVTPPKEPPQRFKPEDIVRADLRGGGVEGDLLGPGVQLARGGGMLGGQITAIDAASVRFTGGGREQTAPLADVARVLFAPTPEAALRRLPAGFTGGLLSDGDLFEGTIRALDARQARINSLLFGLRRFDLPAGGLLAAALRDITPAPAPYRVKTAAGSLVGATTLQIAADGLICRDPAKGDVKIPLADVSQFGAGDARALPLSGLTPRQLATADPIRASAGYRSDATPGSRAVTLGRQPHARGIAVPAGVSVTYALPAGYETFACTAGVPAGTPPAEAVVFTLLLDGRQVFRSAELTSAAAPAQINWNLGAARTLTLQTEPVRPGGAGTPALWAEPFLLKR